MKRAVFIILVAIVVLLVGCSSNNQAVEKENEQLKSKISQLEKDLSDKNNKITELQKIESKNLTINYLENASSKRFIEKKCDLIALPVENSIKLNSITENTVVDVLDTAGVGDDIWLYISIPVYDSPTNYKGWIKESDTVPYTKDKIKRVLGDVKVKIGEKVYETDDIKNINSVAPSKAQDGEHGRIMEKKDGYVKLQCPGGKIIWVKETSVIYPKVE